MRVSEIFARGGGWGYNGGYESYLGYGGVDTPGGYYPDNGRWTYLAPNSYNYQSQGCGYGYTRNHYDGGIVG